MKTKTIAATTPETLARTLGLSGVEAQKWQVQHALLKRLRQIVVEGGLPTQRWHEEAVLPGLG